MPAIRPHENRLRRALFRRLAATAMALALAPLVGCPAQPTAAEPAEHEHERGLHDHDHHVSEHRPRDFGEAVAALRRLHRHVFEELEEGHFDHAAEELSQLRDVIRWLPEIAGDSDMPEGQWNEAHAAAKRLEQIYGPLSAKVRRGERADAETAGKQAEREFAALDAIAKDGAWRGATPSADREDDAISRLEI
jgi:hypothetical protein